MRTKINHLAESITSVSLKILVFGPDPRQAVRHPRSKAGKIARKRIEIKDWLTAKGHTTDFPEDIYARASSRSISNISLQELAMMRRYDLIIVLVENPGSLTELGLIAGNTNLAQKSHIFVDSAYKGGFAYKAGQSVKLLKGAFSSFAYPTDITECHLLTKISKTIDQLRIMKFLVT